MEIFYFVIPNCQIVCEAETLSFGANSNLKSFSHLSLIRLLSRVRRLAFACLGCAVGFERQANVPRRGGHYPVRAAWCITTHVYAVVGKRRAW
jgi:hypothetical protein